MIKHVHDVVALLGIALTAAHIDAAASDPMVPGEQGDKRRDLHRQNAG